MLPGNIPVYEDAAFSGATVRFLKGGFSHKV